MATILERALSRKSPGLITYQLYVARHCIQSARPRLLHTHRLISARPLLCKTPYRLTQPSCLLAGTLVRRSSQFSPGQRQSLLVAVYGSFAIGGFLILAITIREIKRKRLEWKGIEEISFSGFRKMKLYKYKDVALPEFVVRDLENIENFKARPDDVWVVSFPRSGTTWLQEIVYLIQTNMDMNGAVTQLLDDRFPYLEFMYPGLQTIEDMPSPRLIKSHLPLSLLPKSVHEEKPKIIYIARNPRDVVVSYYHFVRLLYPVSRFDGKFEDFFNMFVDDKVMYGPWTAHVKDFWDMRHDESILYLTYEDLKKDTAGCIKKIAQFLGKQLSSGEIEEIMKHCSFNKMKSNNKVNHDWFNTLGVTDPTYGEFMRKGCIGDWTNYFTQDMGRRMNERLGKAFIDSDISFSYEGSHIVDNR